MRCWRCFNPLLLALAQLSLKWFGLGFSAFGFLPSVLALALYSMLPVLRNTITGLQSIDPAILEAAEGVGMTQGQSLRMVELPLALPIMMAGIRTAAVWVIGTATLSTPIGQTVSATTSSPVCRPRTGCSCCSAAAPQPCSRSPWINCSA